MSALLAAIATGAKPMIGMLQLPALAGSSRYRDTAIDDLVACALRDARLLRDAGFDALMVQNLGDLPVARRVSAAQVAWMTRVAGELRAAIDLPLGLNFLENDADAMFAVASATGVDFVRVKVYVGAMATPAGVESGQAFAAIRARTALRIDRVAIFADVHDRTASPLASAGLADDVRSAFAIGGADGVVLTGRSSEETRAMLAAARAVVSGKPLIVGGGVSRATLPDVLPLLDAAIVGSALKSDESLFGALDAAKAVAFMEDVRAARTR